MLVFSALSDDLVDVEDVAYFWEDYSTIVSVVNAVRVAYCMVLSKISPPSQGT